MMSIVGSQLTPEAKKEAQNTLNALYFGEARQTLTNNAGGGKLDPRTLMGV
ncbi:hypothetical protein [Deefgea sp. CFH1-16]|uniref:hypothetical protein n=1 Tax=Deefgea sp. CFH1-16 TaxID=2675457 RepID=UPI001940380D|nr:hypothetical protein [Deefgea sp. CFH1-16]MBM5575837.1 hypothetical protein [Deefgea sp. CFH1-16]